MPLALGLASIILEIVVMWIIIHLLFPELGF